MNRASIPSHAQHRERLLHLSSGKTIRTGEALLHPADVAKPLSTDSSVNDERREPIPPDVTPPHVSPNGEDSEIENEVGTFVQTDSKAEAEELAAEIAKDCGDERVSIRASDGSVETGIPL
jgi:hypothetical protein